MRQPNSQQIEVLVGPETADDAGVFRLPDGQLVVQTVDFFTPVVDEPYDWGRIAAANAVSDVYAMGGIPVAALQLIGWPRDELSFEMLGEVVEGGQDVLGEAGCVIVGGHSIDDEEPKYGFAVTGLVGETQLVTNAGAQPGDALVLTKPLGTGIISTAIKRGRAPEAVRDDAVAVMVALNAGASRAMATVDTRSATDITGYGLLGHLGEIVQASGQSATVDSAAVPLIDGVRELAEEGIYPSGSHRNRKAVERFCEFGDLDDTSIRLLADAQTSGGMLISVAPTDTTPLLDALEAEETLVAAVIGEVTGGDGTIYVS